MRRTKKAGERRRDEQRAGGPRMHGRNWHEHPEPRQLPTELRDLDALPEAESSGEREGMGKGGSHGSGAGSRK